MKNIEKLIEQIREYGATFTAALMLGEWDCGTCPVRDSCRAYDDIDECRNNLITWLNQEV